MTFLSNIYKQALTLPPGEGPIARLLHALKLPENKSLCPSCEKDCNDGLTWALEMYSQRLQSADECCPRCKLLLACAGAVMGPIQNPRKSDDLKKYFQSLMPFSHYYPRIDREDSDGRYKHFLLQVYRVDENPFLDEFENTNDPIPWRKHLPGYTDSRESFSTISSWLNACVFSHEECSRGVSKELNPGLPRRVLDLRNKSIVLRENLTVENSSESTNYACLTHCWGPDAAVTKTTLDNLEKFKTAIPVRELTETFRDTVAVCRQLNISFLWIDSLCIIQDSVADWTAELSQLDRIYEHAYVLIAATASADSSGGLFQDTHHTHLSKPLDQGAYVRLEVCILPDLVPSFLRLPKRQHWPLFDRAWTFQEMQLARRTIHFGRNEAIWRCRRGVWSESGTNDTFSGHDSSKLRFRDAGSFEMLLAPLAIDSSGDFHKLKRAWHEIVERYSRLKLTKEADKLPALSGIAKWVQKTRGPGDEYFAGLWRDTLVEDLEWRIIFPEKRPAGASVPSWSWASARGMVSYTPDVSRLPSSVVCVENIRCDSKGPSHLGIVDNALVAIRGRIVRRRAPATFGMMPDRKSTWDESAERGTGKDSVKDTESTVQLDRPYTPIFQDLFPPPWKELYFCDFASDKSELDAAERENDQGQVLCWIPLMFGGDWAHTPEVCAGSLAPKLIRTKIVGIIVRDIGKDGHHERVGHMEISRGDYCPMTETNGEFGDRIWNEMVARLEAIESSLVTIR